MGQAATREHRHSHDEASSSPTSAHLNFPSTVDGGALEPQGVYPGPHDYDHNVVKLAIVQRKLMPFYKGHDDEEAYSGQVFNTECPICFLYYPSTLNQTRCCAQPMCTECFVEIKRADPNHTKPPSSQPTECPFCTADNFGVVFVKPNLSPPDDSQADGSGASATQTRRKSFAHNAPDVLTTDLIRPDWQEKLAAAQATTLRRANRRIIMRQVGDRLIPIGVSSSRAGAEMPEGAGPGGAIILREGEEWGPLAAAETGSRNRRGSRRGGLSGTGSGIMQLAGQDVEEMMLMEAMRLSLLEHEEQQRRQSQQLQDQSTSATHVASTGNNTPVVQSAHSPSTGSGVTLGRSSSTSRGQPMAPASLRANRLSQDIRNASAASELAGTPSPLSPKGAAVSASAQPAPLTNVSPRGPPTQQSRISERPGAQFDFGLRDDVLGELAELIDEPNEDMRCRIEAAKVARNRAAEVQVQSQRADDEVSNPPGPNAVAGSSSRATNTLPTYPVSSSARAGLGASKLPLSATTSPAATPPGSPSIVSRPLSSTNPFRSRLASSGNNTPVRLEDSIGHRRVSSQSGTAPGGVPAIQAFRPSPLLEEPWSSSQQEQQQHQSH